ncbi:hypothetical protein LCGC14_3122070 [marine sediment metagenome]|uniref:Uncharacterized protein n=1 Tax=marine sediment metagenome TaxID=412755 RepID=A0A0F8W286_9ZZZZ|nr:hypothetical protein [bacterium]
MKKSQEPQKFSVDYIVTYNSLTLKEAADKEASIKKRYKDACNVKVVVKEVSSIGIGSYIHAPLPILDPTVDT